MRQKWGQNFLVDLSAAERIVRALEPQERDTVLEIGPGKGILTQILRARVQRLIAVELDKHLAAFLESKWAGQPGFSVVTSDFLLWPLPEWPARSVKVIGNLPYSAANAILRRILDWASWKTAVVMVQREVAERIVAAPGGRDYGILSLAVQSKAQAELLFHVPPSAFRPRPQVTSTVLRLKPWPRPRVSHEQSFFEVVRAAFSQRRKTVLNSLSSGLSLEKKDLEPKLVEAGINPDCRAETLSLETFDRLSEVLRNDLRKTKGSD
jgi:16S rRNA (adenine1518-N6/adenine1519-N6)-dimethyltransferase